MEHERWSRTYKDFTTFQLERAQEDVRSAEDQLKSAEEYMCSTIDAIRCLGFTVESIDSDTVAVVKIHDSMFPNILYLLTTNVFIRHPYRLSVGFSCYIFAPWLSVYTSLSFFLCIQFEFRILPIRIILTCQILTCIQGRRWNSNCHK